MNERYKKTDGSIRVSLLFREYVKRQGLDEEIPFDEIPEGYRWMWCMDESMLFIIEGHDIVTGKFRVKTRPSDDDEPLDKEPSAHHGTEEEITRWFKEWIDRAGRRLAYRGLRYMEQAQGGIEKAQMGIRQAQLDAKRDSEKTQIEIRNLEIGIAILAVMITAVSGLNDVISTWLSNRDKIGHLWSWLSQIDGNHARVAFFCMSFVWFVGTSLIMAVIYWWYRSRKR